MLHEYDPINVTDPTRREIPSDDDTDAPLPPIYTQADLDQARREARAATFKDAAGIVSRLPVHVSRSGVKKGSDINGWSSAINQSVIALEAAADSTQKDNEHHG